MKQLQLNRQTKNLNGFYKRALLIGAVFCLAFSHIAASEVAVITFDTRTHFGSRVANSISQEIFLSEANLLHSVISMSENRNPNGTWTFSVYQKRRLIARFHFSTNYLRTFPSAISIAQTVVARLRIAE